MISLYVKKGCPYSKKVIDFIHEKGAIDVTILYQQNANNKEKAEEIGGKTQAPLLVDQENDTVMYESDDIIEYLKNR